MGGNEVLQVEAYTAAEQADPHSMLLLEAVTIIHTEMRSRLKECDEGGFPYDAAAVHSVIQFLVDKLKIDIPNIFKTRFPGSEYREYSEREFGFVAGKVYELLCMEFAIPRGSVQ